MVTAPVETGVAVGEAAAVGAVLGATEATLPSDDEPLDPPEHATAPIASATENAHERCRRRLSGA